MFSDLQHWLCLSVSLCVCVCVVCMLRKSRLKLWIYRRCSSLSRLVSMLAMRLSSDLTIENLRPLSHWKFSFQNSLSRVSFARKFVVNSLLSKWITFKILLRNSEHVLFCEIKFHEISLDFQNTYFYCERGLSSPIDMHTHASNTW